MLTLHKYILCFLCLIALIKSDAQEIKFTHITAEQGLSQSSVYCTLQDSWGFMWFGTQDGLNKYDGYNITTFKHNQVDTNSLSNSIIWSLCEDKNKNLWIGEDDGGLDEYNLHTGKVKHHQYIQNGKNVLSNHKIFKIIQDNEGLIWIATDNGLYTYESEKNIFTSFFNDKKNKNSISADNIYCVYQSKNGTLWFGTNGGGLESYNKKTKQFEHHNSTSNLENENRVSAIYEDNNNTLWIGTYGNGIKCFDIKQNKFITTNDKFKSIENSAIFNITQSSDSLFWIGTFGDGIILYDKNKNELRNIITEEYNENALNNNSVYCLFNDAIGSVWVGTNGGGVNVHFPATNKFQHYKKRYNSNNGLQSNTVLALLEDKEGLVWIGTDEGGVTTLNRKTSDYHQYPQLSTASSNSVVSLCEDNEGIIWVGTWGRGINSYNKKTKNVSEYKEIKDLGNITVLDIMQDSNQKIWIATYSKGIFVYDKKTKKFNNYSIKNGLNTNQIYSVFEDKQKNIWIGTDGGGINKLNVASGSVKYFVHNEKKNSVSSNSVNCFYEDKHGNLWIATSNGLDRYNPNTDLFENFFEKDGLPNDVIYCVMPDKAGHLWLSTNKGIAEFNPEIANVNGSAFRNYSIGDGLQGLEFNMGAFYKNENGEMFFGGLNGFNILNPEEIKMNQNIPPVHITSYKRLGKEIILDSLIYNKTLLTLTWRENFFSLDFNALDYQMPAKNKFSFILEDVDGDWSPPSTQHFVSYTELGGGDYVFKVRACNNDGVWNEEGAKLYIHINPPFWRTKLFYSFCIAFATGCFWAFFAYRTKAIKRENKILEEKVKERTLELAEKNKDITSSIEYAQRIQLAILPPLDHIYKNFPDSFVLYKPKDIVSGDFYWFAEKDGKKIIAVVDCTGHGVPGAFMSMIGHNLLNQIINENGITQPNEILNQLHHGVQVALRQGTNELNTSDGMDVSICVVNDKNTELLYSGAYRPLIKINKNILQKTEGDKFPIGGSHFDAERKFTCHTIFINAGDSFYLSSDGYADQFGGGDGKKFMIKRFNEILISMQDKKMTEQGGILENTIIDWRGEQDQVDDILVIGIRF